MYKCWLRNNTIMPVRAKGSGNYRSPYGLVYYVYSVRELPFT